jgi:hypothetical protein
MKYFDLNPFVFSFFIAAIVLFSSCESDKDQVPTDDIVLVKEESEVISSYNDVDNLTLFALQSNGLGLRTLLEFKGDICANTNVNFNEGARRITIDFGAGCTSPNGIIRKGKVILEYTGLFYIPGTVITATFEGFEVNGKKLEGIRRTVNKGVDINAQTITLETTISDGKVTWADGKFATITLNHTRKITLPASGGGILVEVTGNSIGTSREGKKYIASIGNVLNYLQACTDTGNWIPSAGTLKIIVDNTTEYNIDYGVGACDKETTVTVNGKSYTVTFDR